MRDQSKQKKFVALLRPNVDALYRTAMRLSRDQSKAEDLVQETSLRAYRSFVTVAEPENFRAWIFRILINLHIDQSRNRTSFADILDVDKLQTPDAGPAQSFANARLGRDLVAAVDALPEDLRLVVQLVLVEGMSYRDASNSIGCNVATIKSRLHRARLLLRAGLAAHAPAPTDTNILKFPPHKETSK